jgi:3'-phosphoadenosine 5'-phosphosulfate sulfotransferase (PAPS reductase)/FAD synthetase
MIDQLIERGAIFFINDSGGKDSQAMKIFLSKVIPKDQLVIIHADLPEVDWEGCWDHVVKYSMGIEHHMVRAVKTFFQMVEHRGKFPSPTNRQCTSDLKRDPIDKFIRHWCKTHGRYLVVNCMGIRADESDRRSKATPFKVNTRNGKAGREWYDWYPIFEWGIDEVWAEIASAGQKPHYAYELGMSRLSCVFCIMSNKSDIRTAARHRPELYRKYVQTEERLGFTLQMSGEEKNWLKNIVEAEN